MEELLKIFSAININIEKDVELFSGERYSLVQIAPKNSKLFIDFYLSNYKNIHTSIGRYSATEEILKNVYIDNEKHKNSSIYLVLKRDGNFFATLKGTKRSSEPFRIENEFGFDVLKYLNCKYYNDVSIWHHSKTSLDKSQLVGEEKLKIRNFLKTLYFALYSKLYLENCEVLLGEVNDLNYKSMDANNIKMEIVTESIKTIGMPAYGIAITKQSIFDFLHHENFVELFESTLC